MARIYALLASIALTLLAANLAIGLWYVDNYGGAARDYIRLGREYQDNLRRGRFTDEQQAAAQAEVAAATATFERVRDRQQLHFLLGVLGSLVAVLVNSIAVTYFVGTSRWCKEVVDTYGLDKELVRRSDRLKRRTFPWSVMGMLLIVAIVALGAMSDPWTDAVANPAGDLGGSARWRHPHLFTALVGTLLIGYGFWVQLRNIAANYAVIEEIVALVQAKRQERGLEV